MLDLKFGDVVEWYIDRDVVRWMLVRPLSRVQWEAVWMVSPEEDHGRRWEAGQMKVIGVSRETKVIRG